VIFPHSTKNHLLSVSNLYSVLEFLRKPMMFPHHHQYDSRFVNQAFGDVYETFLFHMHAKVAWTAVVGGGNSSLYPISIILEANQISVCLKSWV